MDRLVSVDFHGSFEDLFLSSIARDFKKAVLADDLSEKKDGYIPWMPISILAVVNNRSQRFNGMFRIKQESSEWVAETKFNLKGFYGKKFIAIVEDNDDTIAQEIFAFCATGCSAMLRDRF